MYDDGNFEVPMYDSGLQLQVFSGDNEYDNVQLVRKSIQCLDEESNSGMSCMNIIRDSPQWQNMNKNMDNWWPAQTPACSFLVTFSSSEMKELYYEDHTSITYRLQLTSESFGHTHRLYALGNTNTPSDTNQDKIKVERSSENANFVVPITDMDNMPPQFYCPDSLCDKYHRKE